MNKFCFAPLIKLVKKRKSLAGYVCKLDMKQKEKDCLYNVYKK